MPNFQRIPSSSPAPMANALRPKLDNSSTLQPCNLSNQSDHDFRIGTAASKECPQAPSLSLSPSDRARLAPLANFSVLFCPTLGGGSLAMSQPVSRSTSLPRPCPGKKRDPGNEVVSQPIKYVFSCYFSCCLSIC